MKYEHSRLRGVPDRRRIASGATKHAAAVLKSEVNGYEGVLSRS
jgi:hypothetical protein